MVLGKSMPTISRFLGMIIHVTNARYLSGYQFEVTFTDGRTGVADLNDSLKGAVFEALRDPAFCARGTLDSEIGTIVWPNGADMAPEYFYYLAFRDDEGLADLFREWGYLRETSAATR